MQKSVIKCNYCKKVVNPTYILSQYFYEYFFECEYCGLNTYYDFPSYVPEKQHYRYLKCKEKLQ